MLGGITAEPLAPPVPNRNEPAPGLIPFEPSKLGMANRVPIPRPISPDSGGKIKLGRGPLIETDGRGRNESDEPPPIRPGMNPSVLPP